MQLFVRLILVFALLGGSIHAPALAHDFAGAGHEHGAVAAHDTAADQHDEGGPSHEGAGDDLNHHHCPAALDARGVAVAVAALPGKAILPFYRATALTSLSQAPPTQPPSA